MWPTAGLDQGAPPWAAEKWLPTMVWISLKAEPKEAMSFSTIPGKSRIRVRRQRWPARLREFGQSLEGGAFLFAVNADVARIEDENGAPVGGEVEAHDGRRRMAGCAAAAIDDEAAALEGRDADRGPGATFDDFAEGTGGGLAAGELQHGGADGERQLGSRTQPGVGGDRALHVNFVRLVGSEEAGKAAQRLFSPVGFQVRWREIREPGER